MNKKVSVKDPSRLDVVMTIQHTCSSKHLTLSERAEIEVMIDKGSSFAQIARTLSRDPSTISKEIRSHRLLAPHYRDDKSRHRSECLQLLSETAILRP